MSIYGDPVDHAARHWAEQQIEPDPRLQEWDDAFAEFVAAGVGPKQIRRSYEERIEAFEGEAENLKMTLGSAIDTINSGRILVGNAMLTWEDVLAAVEAVLK